MSAPAVDRYVVAGNPVAHSQSPFIHAEFARQTGEAIDYGRVLWPLDGFAASLDALVASGVKGCNVTVPFKLQAFSHAGRSTPRARLAGAANVLSFGSEGRLADNTDGIGLVNDLQRHAGVRLEARRLLLIGAGGAAAGVLGPLLETGPAQLVVANRTLATAAALVLRHAPVAGSCDLRSAALDDCGTAFDVVVNATASSLQGAAPPVDRRVLRPGTLALDMMYGTASAGFLRWAEAEGATPRDGLGMLVEQAAEAFRLWRGVRPDTAPVLAALRARLGMPVGGR